MPQQSDTKEVHICLVTAQLLANVIPIVLRKPAVIILLISEDMKPKSISFKKLLSGLSFPIEGGEIIEIPFSSKSYLSIKSDFEQMFIELEERYPHHKKIVNFTGGNKLMSLALAKIAELGDHLWESLYVEINQDKIEWVKPENKPAENVPHLINVESYLKAYGFTKRKTLSDDLSWQSIVEARKHVTIWLGQNAPGLDWLISAINTTFQKVQFIKNHPMTLCQPVKGRLIDSAMEKLAEANIITLLPKEDDQYVFTVPSKSEVDYLTGQWLEEFVWLSLKQAGIDEVHCSLDQTDDTNPKLNIRNENDVIAVHRNRLLLIECKTAYLKDEKEFNNVLTKLDSISERISGTFGQRWLVLARLPKSGRNETERNESIARMKKRAQGMRIELVEPENLKSLIKATQYWMKTLELKFEF